MCSIRMTAYDVYDVVRGRVTYDVVRSVNAPLGFEIAAQYAVSTQSDES